MRDALNTPVALLFNSMSTSTIWCISTDFNPTLTISSALGRRVHTKYFLGIAHSLSFLINFLTIMMVTKKCIQGIKHAFSFALVPCSVGDTPEIIVVVQPVSTVLESLVSSTVNLWNLFCNFSGSGFTGLLWENPLSFWFLWHLLLLLLAHRDTLAHFKSSSVSWLWHSFVLCSHEPCVLLCYNCNTLLVGVVPGFCHPSHWDLAMMILVGSIVVAANMAVMGSWKSVSVELTMTMMILTSVVQGVSSVHSDWPCHKRLLQP